MSDTLDPFDYVEPCEPDCTPERHAYHQAQWDMAGRINKAHGFKPYPGAVEADDTVTDMATNSPDDTSGVLEPTREAPDTLQEKLWAILLPLIAGDRVKDPIPPQIKWGNQYKRRVYKRNPGLMMFPELADK